MKKFLPIVMCYVLAAVGAKAQNDTICELKGEKAVVDGLNYLIDKETHEARRRRVRHFCAPSLLILYMVRYCN